MEPFLPHRRRTQPLGAGFTLVEMLVVFSIITILAAVMVNSQSSFNKTIILANTAYDIALSIRSVETYGVSGKALDTSPTVGYGIHLAKTSVINSYTLFADTDPALTYGAGVLSADCHSVSDTTALGAQPGDCGYKTGSYTNDTKVLEYTLANGMYISDFCTLTSSVRACANSNGNTLTSLDIVFARPNPDAFFSPNGIYSSASGILKACLKLTSPQNVSRWISVSSSGVISPNDITTCPT